ncbi:pirin-like protein [Cucumis melo var. makuwa]|uniref:Pirin-like protein n=1 Tax=Cucumis melo var. makuwa TaxID=1194695 RepID=A0A5D3CCD0_CUCMM|nr:pirin-like protein [Cucumis melo var. makuwa]
METKLRLILIHLPSSRKDSRRRIQNISLIKRKLAPFDRRSRPQTLLLKWKVEDRVDGFWRFQKPEGAMIHEDKGRIEGGDLQWMTAGKGIVHSEMPSSIGT